MIVTAEGNTIPLPEVELGVFPFLFGDELK
jgi:hypothetical protein